MKNSLIIIAIIVITYFGYNYLTPPDNGTTITENVVISDSKDLASLTTIAPNDAAVFIIEPANGSTLSSPVTIKFGITNMTVIPAGKNQENSGHHHLLLDLENLPDMSQPLPANENVIHFGKGQTETTIELSPGTHSLQLLLGNYLHVPHSHPVISKKIKINVE